MKVYTCVYLSVCSVVQMCLCECMSVHESPVCVCKCVLLPVCVPTRKLCGYDCVSVQGGWGCEYMCLCGSVTCLRGM